MTTKPTFFLTSICLLIAFATIFLAPLAAAEAWTLFDESVDDSMFATRNATVEMVAQGEAPHLLMTIGSEKITPNLFIRQPNETWDVGEALGLAFDVTNDSDRDMAVHARVDGPGKWGVAATSASRIGLMPGQSGTIRVNFKNNYGRATGKAVDPSQIAKLLVFVDPAQPGDRILLHSVEPYTEEQVEQVNSAYSQTKPLDGVIYGEGMDPGQKIKATTHHAAADITANGVVASLPAGHEEQGVAVRPEVGRWDLRAYLQVDVTLTNLGDKPVTPRIRLDSAKGNGHWVEATTPIESQQTRTITVPFASPKIWQGPQTFESKPYRGTGGTRLASNVVTALQIRTDNPADATQSLRVDRIVASMPPASPLPEWVGKRPPIEGDWALTFEDHFDGDYVDTDTWNIYTSNFWDKRSHFSKDNVIVGDGVARLRFERKTGHHNDDPNAKVTDYATGFLDTYGKWGQRYGYFEARVKLPDAPGMWPAFWLMPDRGPDAGPQWKRADTGNGGMEFDIMEYLSRWGPNRHTIAFHWDGYGKNHKATGTPAYIAPDEEGYVTSGLLWLPGLAVVYCNGREMARWENPRISEVRSYPIFTAVSGGWDNDPIDDAQLPADFVVDYIRVWQRSDLASDVDGWINRSP